MTPTLTATHSSAHNQADVQKKQQSSCRAKNKQSSRPTKNKTIRPPYKKNKQSSRRAKKTNNLAACKILVEIAKWVKYILSHLCWQNIPYVYFVYKFHMQLCYQFAQTYTGFFNRACLNENWILCFTPF